MAVAVLLITWILKLSAVLLIVAWCSLPASTRLEFVFLYLPVTFDRSCGVLQLPGRVAKLPLYTCSASSASELSLVASHRVVNRFFDARIILDGGEVVVRVQNATYIYLKVQVLSILKHQGLRRKGRVPLTKNISITALPTLEHTGGLHTCTCIHI
jgi:hypothetical protein